MRTFFSRTSKAPSIDFLMLSNVVHENSHYGFIEKTVTKVPGLTSLQAMFQQFHELTRTNSWRRPWFVLGHARRWAGSLVLDPVLCWSPQLLLHWFVLFVFSVFPDAFLLTLPITGVSPQSLFDSVRL